MHCTDQKGIIAAATNFIHNEKGNIVYIDQYVDRLNETFFMRIEVESTDQNIDFNTFKEKFISGIGSKYDLNCNFFLQNQRPKLAVFVSKYAHCLYDILAQKQSGELQCEIPFILSNHQDLASIAEQFGIPFYWIPVTKKNKAEATSQQLNLLKKHHITSIVLARYMQILPEQLVQEYPNKIINIHHSFLPAFPGAKPYHSAFEREVKIIGATSHYVTDDLDAGPIIEQDTSRVSHAHGVSDFISKGRDLERLVLLCAIKLHTERKVMVFNNKTVVFT